MCYFLSIEIIPDILGYPRISQESAKVVIKVYYHHDKSQDPTCPMDVNQIDCDLDQEEN